MAIIVYCPAYAVSGLIAAASHSETLERIPPGASVSIGNPVPCSVYQILASPLSTYGTQVPSHDSDSAAQPMAGPSAAAAAAVRSLRSENQKAATERLRLPVIPSRNYPSSVSAST